MENGVLILWLEVSFKIADDRRMERILAPRSYDWQVAQKNAMQIILALKIPCACISVCLCEHRGNLLRKSFAHQ